MKYAAKRFDHMIAELQEWKDMHSELEEYHLALMLTTMDPSNPEYANYVSRIRLLEAAINKVTKDLKKVFSNIRGYKLEADITVKQINKWRQIIPETEKRGDVATVDLVTGKMRVFQAKSTSAHSNGDVNTHLKKAFTQLFGVKGEIPGPGAKLTVVVAIQSKKNLWPFLDKNYLQPSKAATRSTYLKLARTHILAAAKLAYDEADAKRDDPKMDGFLNGLGSSAIVVRFEYKKRPEVKIDGNFVQYQRTRDLDFHLFSAEFSANPSGQLTMTKAKFK
ncbi:MAG: hypothetical protein GQ535_14545 [Rhodobacteraceae bacterium]|nr:hypothetical protein [Paracoccaceae bacterium]